MTLPVGWEDIGLVADVERQPRRVRYAPFGDLDFVDLPAPVDALGAGPLGVSFQCADGRLYWLSGDPALQDTWVILLVWRR